MSSPPRPDPLTGENLAKGGCAVAILLFMGFCSVAKMATPGGSEMSTADIKSVQGRGKSDGTRWIETGSLPPTYQGRAALARLKFPHDPERQRLYQDSLENSYRQWQSPISTPETRPVTSSGNPPKATPELITVTVTESAPAAPENLASPARATPATAQEAQKIAVQKYPLLGVAGSPINTRFLQRCALYRKSKPELFKSADWPLVIANEVAPE